MKKFVEKFNKLRDFLADSIWGNVTVFVFMGAVMYGLVVLAQKYDSPNFKCPKDYATNEEYLDGFDKWLDGELLKNPEATEDELTAKRAKLFTEHHCEKGVWVSRNELEKNINDLDAEKFMEAIKKVESEEPQRISDNPTEEDIYTSEYIKHIRVALNGYLNGINSFTEDSMMGLLDSGIRCGLDAFDKSYYQSKFMVYHAEDNDYGGVRAQIFFVDKPDILFWVWVYKAAGEDSQDEYQLRAFCEAGPTPEQKNEFDADIKAIIKNSKYSL